MGIILGIIILGLLGGWLVNYLADVLPVTRAIGRPVCWNCNTEIFWRDYFLFLKCPNCGKSRTNRTYVLQLLILAMTMYLWFVPPGRIEFPLAFILLLYLMLIATIDIEHRLILHMTSLAGAVIGLGIGIHLHGIEMTLIGGAVGFGVMLAFYFLGEVFVRYMSKRRNETIDEVALGFGDVNLAGITGLLLGWPVIILGLLFTILAGGLISLLVVIVMLVRRQYKAFSAIPYGPFMILSIFVLLFRP
jgi:prepilin signal peptidase PulO-like enzyme (type II secretory pathway)